VIAATLVPCQRKPDDLMSSGSELLLQPEVVGASPILHRCCDAVASSSHL